jgi:hypothetical protein
MTISVSGSTVTFSDSSSQNTAFTGSATNLAGGAAGEIPFQTGSGTTSFTSAGSSGQVLTSAGTGTPTWSTPSAGAMTLISTLTASNSASLSWTGLSGYDKYLVIAENLLPVSLPSGSNRITLGYGATPTYITSNYYYNVIGLTTGSTIATSSSEMAIALQFSSMTYNTTQYQATCLITGCSSGINKGYFVNSYTNDLTTPAIELITKIGTLVNTNAITAIKVTNNGGNLGTGSVSLYGITS